MAYGDKQITVKVDVKLSPKQTEVFKGMKRFTIFRAGRRSGKTWLAIYWLFRRAWAMDNSVSWYVALDVASCNELALPQFLRICPPEIIRSFNKTSRKIVLINGATILFKTAESRDGLRGRSIDTLVCEEAAYWHCGNELWHEVLRAQVADSLGHVLFISSPKGNNWFRQLEVKALDGIRLGKKDWAVYSATIWDNPFITNEEKLALQDTTPELVWRQEYLAEFVDEVGQVYWEINPIKNIVDIPPTSPVMLSVRGLDWGIGDFTACTWINLLQDGRAFVSQEYEEQNLSAQAQAKAIIGATFTNPRWSFLDSSAFKRESDLSSVAQRFAVAGLPCIPATKDLDGSLSDVKALIADGKLIITRKCRRILSYMQTWEHGSHEPDLLAALRYGVAGLVKSGKLIPPVRYAKPKTITELIEGDKVTQARQDRINAKYSGLPTLKVFSLGNM